MNDSKRRRLADRFSDRLEHWGEHITSAVGTMWTAIAFSMLALISLPGAIASGNVVVIVAWIAQTFLQLVLLPIIMVGQNVQGRRTEKRDQETHNAVMAAHRETQEILRELHARNQK